MDVTCFLFCMSVICLNFLIILILVGPTSALLTDLGFCHDDFTLKPRDGLLKEREFNWLAFVQYVHVTTNLPHHSKAPRVVMVHKQFVLGTAADLMNLPKNYKVGKIIFGVYDRDEEDCDLTKNQVRMGMTCPKAYMEMPIYEVTAHPEFARFGIGNSLALVKLIRSLPSSYMIPVCLPSSLERETQKRKRRVFMIDYLSAVPKELENEHMAKRTLKLYTHRDCKRHRLKKRLGSEGVTHVLCSSGCGMRPGSPIISQSVIGNFEVLGLAVGGTPCRKRSMRRKLNQEPPLYIDVYPYISWITNVITANTMPLPYSPTFKLTEGESYTDPNKKYYLRRRRKQKHGWKARTYVSGNLCFKPISKQRKAVNFFTERFEVNADPPAKLNIIMKISSGIECTIVCAKLMMPNRLSLPVVKGVGGYNITIEFNTEWFPYTFQFSVVLAGKNTTMSDFMEWIDERSPGFW